MEMKANMMLRFIVPCDCGGEMIVPRDLKGLATWLVFFGPLNV